MACSDSVRVGRTVEKWSLSSFSDAFCCQPPQDPSSSSEALGRCPSTSRSHVGNSKPAPANASSFPRGSLRLLDAFLAPLPRCLPNWPNERLGRVSLHCGAPHHPCPMEGWSSSARSWARARQCNKTLCSTFFSRIQPDPQEHPRSPDLVHVSASWCLLSTQLLRGRPSWLPRSVLRMRQGTFLHNSH